MAAAGVKIAPWLRYMVRRVTITDFPASCHERTGERRHDSRTYPQRFMLRLDASSQMKLQQLITRFGVSKAEIIRQLISRATLEDFPNSWQIRAGKRRTQQGRQNDMGRDEQSKP
ncbi:MAG TPA: hypothetical protein VLK82_25475 [Candidatus Tectomicrobia bacterium]|nr:hypothetical protein [Candidatus Tectomicrobia bacterium]